VKKSGNPVSEIIKEIWQSGLNDVFLSSSPAQYQRFWYNALMDTHHHAALRNT